MAGKLEQAQENMKSITERYVYGIYQLFLLRIFQSEDDIKQYRNILENKYRIAGYNLM